MPWKCFDGLKNRLRFFFQCLKITCCTEQQSRNLKFVGDELVRCLQWNQEVAFCCPRASAWSGGTGRNKWTNTNKHVDAKVKTTRQTARQTDSLEHLSRSLLCPQHKVLAEEKLHNHIVEMNVKRDMYQTCDLWPESCHSYQQWYGNIYPSKNKENTN